MYSQLKSQFLSAGLDYFNNEWSSLYDFNDAQSFINYNRPIYLKEKDREDKEDRDKENGADKEDRDDRETQEAYIEDRETGKNWSYLDPSIPSFVVPYTYGLRRLPLKRSSSSFFHIIFLADDEQDKKINKVNRQEQLCYQLIEKDLSIYLGERTAHGEKLESEDEDKQDRKDKEDRQADSSHSSSLVLFRTRRIDLSLASKSSLSNKEKVQSLHKAIETYMDRNELIKESNMQNILKKLKEQASLSLRYPLLILEFIIEKDKIGEIERLMLDIQKREEYKENMLFSEGEQIRKTIMDSKTM
jgi:hypothetical protein